MFSQSAEEDLFDAADVGSGNGARLDQTKELVGAGHALFLLLKLDCAGAPSDDAADVAEGVCAHERQAAAGGGA